MVRLLQGLYKKSVFLFCCLGGMLLTACGIQSFIYLEKPQRSGHDPSNLAALNDRYCAFQTTDAQNIAAVGAYFQGTEIYYRIYERKNDCENDRSQINKYNDDNPFSAAQYLETSKRYYRLATDQISTRPLIGIQSSNVTVRFRLQDYGIPVTDPAQLTIDGVSQGLPRRDGRIQNSKIFDRENIARGDDDVQRSSVPSEVNDYWYVNFYAVSYGYTTTFSTLYSALEYLGYILIEKKP